MMKSLILTLLFSVSGIANAEGGLGTAFLSCTSADRQVIVHGLPLEGIITISDGSDRMTLIDNRAIEKQGEEAAMGLYPGYMNIPVKSTAKIFNQDDPSKRSFKIVAAGVWKEDRPISAILLSRGPIAARKLALGYSATFEATLVGTHPSGIQGRGLNVAVSCELKRTL